MAASARQWRMTIAEFNRLAAAHPQLLATDDDGNRVLFHNDDAYDGDRDIETINDVVQLLELGHQVDATVCLRAAVRGDREATTVQRWESYPLGCVVVVRALWRLAKTQWSAVWIDGLVVEESWFSAYASHVPQRVGRVRFSGERVIVTARTAVVERKTKKTKR